MSPPLPHICYGITIVDGCVSSVSNQSHPAPPPYTLTLGVDLSSGRLGEDICLALVVMRITLGVGLQVILDMVAAVFLVTACEN